jgi:predicted nucleic acid-binding protein
VIYFDSDVIFHFLVLQDDQKHRKSRELVFLAIDTQEFAISSLAIQEVGFGLARFGISGEEISAKLTFLHSINTIEIQNSDITRALALAQAIGYKHINDCVHTAVAERVMPKQFYTYNKSDFSRIKKLARVTINILT